MSDSSAAEVIRNRRNALFIKKGYQNLLVRVFIIALVTVLLFTQIFLVCQVSGNSMYPAMRDGDLVIAYRLQKKYEKHDTVVFRADGKRQVGRVLAFEGDLVQITKEGTLLVNGTIQIGQILYPTYFKNGAELKLTVPENSCFILCDYRTRCKDSRDYGSISMDGVEGKIISLFRRRSI